MQGRLTRKFVFTEAGSLWLDHCDDDHSGWRWEWHDNDGQLVARSDRSFETVESCAIDAFDKGFLPPASTDEQV